MPNNFQIPDLIKICGEHFETRVNQHCRAVGEATRRWIDEHAFLDERTRDALPGMQIELLASLCYPTCDMSQLRTTNDLSSVAFLGRYHTKGVNEQAHQVALASVADRLKRAMNERWGNRFQTGLDSLETDLRNVQEPRRNMSEEELLSLKRTSEIFDLGFTLIEYTEDLELSDANLQAFPLPELRQKALDAVIWMKDIVAYNTQQSRNEKDNLIMLLMNENQITLERAIVLAADRLKQCVQEFVRLSNENEGKPMGQDVLRYIQGLRDWIVGWAHWVYETEEYFLKKGEDVQAFGWVFLLPKEDKAD
ncbi:terpenoid synthase [Trametopsis cervina]|nr:terpenoid synthase [Trametopsis cervina]